MARLRLFTRLCAAGVFAMQSSVVEARAPAISAGCVMPPSLEDQATYPVQLDIHGDASSGLGSGVVTITHSDGADPMSVDCAKARILMRLAPGSYIATVDPAAGPTRSLRFQVSPSRGTKDLALQIPPSTPELTAR